MNPIKICFADAHAGVRKSFITNMGNEINCSIIAEGNNGKELLVNLKASKQIADIAIVDLAMPIMNGYETVALLKANYPCTKILVIAYTFIKDALQHLLNMGVNGFLSKSDPKFNFGSAILEIQNTGFLKNQYYTKPNSHNIRLEKYTFHGLTKFTKPEFTFIQYKVRGFNIATIAKQMCRSPKTVENYRDNIYTKLGIHSTEQLLKYAKSIGLENWSD